MYENGLIFFTALFSVFDRYHHPAFHDNLYLTAEWVMRRTRIKSFSAMRLMHLYRITNDNEEDRSWKLEVGRIAGRISLLPTSVF
jgi:hypothetical protein